MEDFDSDIEEAVDHATVEEDAPETQAERLGRLHQEGELTDEEFNLLQTEIIESESNGIDNLSTAAASQQSSGESSDNDSWAEEIQFDIVQELRKIIPEDKFSNSMEQISIEDKSTDNISFMMISYLPDEGGFSYFWNLHERSHEERLFELLDGNTWEVISDSSDDSFQPSVMIRRTSSQDGFQDNLPKGYVEDEITYLVDLIQTVYEADLSDIRLN